MIKSLLLIAALVSYGFAQTAQPPQVLTQFLGVNQNDPSVSIGNEAQDALNVESSLNGTALLKRSGYSRIASLTVSTSAPSGSYSFVDPNGNNQQIVCQDHNCAKSTNSSGFSVFLSTAGGTCMPTRWQFAQIGGFIYAVNDCHDVPWKYDGTTRTPLPTAPLGSLIEATKDRLVISGVTASPSNVYYSQSGTPTNFTTGLNSADPYVDTIGAQGDQVRALKYSLGRFFIFKTNSITSCILGDQYSSRCFPVSNSVGTSDPLSVVEIPGSILFRGSDGNYWSLDDSGLNVISKKLSGLVATQNGGSTQSNTQTSQADWNTGTQYGPGTWNTATNNGSIFASSFTVTDNTTAQFLLGTSSGAGVSYYNSIPSVQFAGVTSTYVFRYDALVLPDNSSLSPYQWTNVLSPGQTASIGGGTSIYTSTLTITSTAGSGQGNYNLGFTVQRDTSTIVVLSGKEEGAGTGGFLINAGNSNIAAIAFSSSSARYGSGSIPVIVTENISAHAFSTYTVIITTPGYVSYYRNGIFKSSAAFINPLANAQDEPNKVFISPGVDSSLTSYTFYRFILLGSGVNDAAPFNINTATFTSRIYDLGISTPTAGQISIASFTPTGTTLSYSVRTSSSPNNDMWGSYASFSNGTVPPIAQRYAQIQSSMTQNGFVDSPGISSITLQYATTGQFVTQCIQPGSGITSWGQISCAQTLTGNASLVFYATSAATCASLPTVPPLTAAGSTQLGWTSQTNNSTLSISTNAAVFIAFRSLLTAATDQAQVDACTLYWNNGTAAQPSWGTFDPVKNAVYWTASVNNSATSNRVLKYDLNLNEWYPFGLNATSIFRDVSQNAVYFGDSTGGFWNKYGGVTSDNGSAINAYWISRDFGNPQNPFVDNDFQRISLVTKNQVTGSMTVNYSLSNGDSNSYTVSLSTTASTVYVHSNAALTQSSPAEFMNIKLGNNSTNGFEIDALQLDYGSWGWSEQNP